MKYELAECTAVRPTDIEELMAEFEASGEFCNALWRAGEIGAAAWIDEMKTEEAEGSRHEFVLGFFVGDMMAGVARVTPHPSHEANGNVGYYLRPSFRGARYGPVLLHLIEDFCMEKGIEDVNAVTSVMNTASMKTLAVAGWTPTGRAFVWRSEYNTRNALEFRPVRLSSYRERGGE